jgi:hypothetical protein
LTVGESFIVGGALRAGDPLRAGDRMSNGGGVSTGCRASTGDPRAADEELYRSEPPTAGGILSTDYQY